MEIIMFNSGLEQPEDRGILLKDIIEHDGDFTYMSDKFVNRQQGRKCLRDDLDGKAVNLSAMEYVKNGRQGDYLKCLSEKEMAYMMRSESTKEHKPRILRAKGMEEKSNTITQSIHKGVPHGVVALARAYDRKNGLGKEIDKSYCLNASDWRGLNRNQTQTAVTIQCKYRKLTPRECMRLQTVPEHHIDTLLNSGLSNTQLYKMTGNGWTMEVVKHIFKGLVKMTSKLENILEDLISEMSPKYRIIYADPPWQYNDKSMNRGGAERHYSTMTINDLKEMPVNDLAAKDSLIFMWATFPLLPEALDLMESWGFEYKTCGFTWVKQNKLSDGLYMGMGGYTRSNAEICLVGKKGKGVPRVDCSIRQTQIHRIQGHSKKPDAFRTDLEKLYGDVPRLEMFARNSTEGWSVFGNEVENSIRISHGN